MPAPELLRASHIMLWSESVEHRLNPCNGLCLSATFDVTFDRRSISFDVVRCIIARLCGVRGSVVL